MQKPLQLAFAAGLLFSTSLSVAEAQEQKTTTTAEEVTVYATRSAQPTFDVPALVTRIDADAPGNASAGTVSDLLQFTPGVEVENGPLRSSQVVTIRGFDDEAIVTLIDGRRQNFESGHDGRFFVDTNILKSVEVVRGSSSASYGGGAIGGVVAFETKDAADLLDPGQSFGALTSTSYRSANGELSPSVSVFGRAKELDVLANVNFVRSGDVATGANTHIPANDRVYSGLFKAGYTFSDFHTVKFNAQALDHDANEPSNSSALASTSNSTVDKEIRDRQFGLKYAYDNPGQPLLQPKAHLYLNRSEVDELDISGSNAGRNRSRKMETWGLTLDNNSRFDVSETLIHTISVGTELYTDEQNSGTNKGLYGGVPTAEAENYGVYLQDNAEWRSNVGTFNLIPAIRYDKYQSEDQNGNSQNEHALSPKVSLSYKPTETFMIYGSWSRAFRAPNLTELYASGTHFTAGPFTNVFIANPDLKPETVTTYEAGAGMQHRGVLAGDDRFEVKGSYFMSKGDDFIDQEVNGTTSTQYVNVPHAKLYGWEVQGTYALGGFNAKVGASYSTASNEDNGHDLGNKRPLLFLTDLSYLVDDLDSTFGWRSRVAGKNDSNDSTISSTNGYWVNDFYFRFQGDEGALADLTVDLGVENAFDTAYTANFASLYGEGRSYTAKVSYRW